MKHRISQRLKPLSQSSSRLKPTEHLSKVLIARNKFSKYSYPLSIQAPNQSFVINNLCSYILKKSTAVTQYLQFHIYCICFVHPEKISGGEVFFIHYS